MNTDEILCTQWLQLRERLQLKQLLGGEGASLSLRVPAAAAMWFGAAREAAPRRLPLNQDNGGNTGGEEGAHAAVYRARPDVGAIGWGGGSFGVALADFGGTMPQLFDEQARHLGPMAPATPPGTLARSLQHRGNVLMLQGRPLCLGTTATRLALNAELFEKCAKAHVLAVAAGGRVQALPWWVRWIANGRMRKDAARAEARFAQGLLPEESKGY
ncbi:MULTISPECIES: class II aldolase/adducin family protein [unclassified Rhizobacter]|uniref:class II aldolase/adducin family protein n=1 Tax=unclassified Rhizobacter TaxID=2640088 RepID=UPI0006F4C39A|nr:MULTISPECIES: class II aldolase/adducin family protein [unclassified Rhizobacter]KQU75955.1 hypothetical protein ASC88_23910 [Rhizobacter sp. Root29]KQW08790.1 hypothetical protein ASC98_25070 [Rhizobacter sp. Root1238]KRB16360.1 hypothetical protein ASE08_25950 [Rhizobacter sp. Root16D2]